MDLYGLIGFPLAHSYSRAFFNGKFEKEGLDARYRNFEMESVEELPDMLANQPDLKGLNVTIPHKCTVMPFLDAVSDEAREVGAVNVIRITRTGGRVFLKGYNTDVMGFVQSISPLLKPNHRKALVLGTGGASRAVCCGLKKLGLQTASVSRNREKAQFSYQELSADVLREYHVVVNCTPLGMYPAVNACPDVPYVLLGKEHLLFDLVYNPEETLFLKRGKFQGAMVKNGLEMLHLQALSAWNIWNNCQEANE